MRQNYINPIDLCSMALKYSYNNRKFYGYLMNSVWKTQRYVNKLQ